MEDSSKRFVSRSVFPVWQLVQISRTFVCTFKSYFHQTLEPSNFFSRVNIQKLLRICLPFKPFLSCSMNSNDLSFTNWLTVFRLFFFFPHSFLIHNVARARTLLSFPVTIFFSFENLLQIVRVAFISGRILVSKLIYSDSR